MYTAINFIILLIPCHEVLFYCSGGKNPDHAPTSFLLDNKVLIDTGTVMNKLDSEELLGIDYVLLSHAHFDHIQELPYLALTFMEEKPNDFHVYASGETTEYVLSNIFNNRIWPDLFTISSENNGNLHWNTFEHLKKFNILNYSVTSIPVHHTIPTNGFIIDNGENAFAFTGDTYITDQFWEFCNHQENLKAIIVDVCLPNQMLDLAEKVSHLTPNVLASELEKLTSPGITIFVTHIKPSFRQQVIEQIDEIESEYDLIVLEEDMEIEI